MGATRVNYFLRRADEYGQADGDHASSRTDPDDTERPTGIYRSEGRGRLFSLVRAARGLAARIGDL